MTPPESPASRNFDALFLFSRFTAVFVLFLIFAGGLVTSTRSGLAVPDWPLSYGRLMPKMTGGIVFEHGHRMIAGAAGLLILALTAWVWATQKRGAPRLLSALAAGGVILQAVLGGLTVLFSLPAPISISHAVLGQTVLLLTVCLSESLSWGGTETGAGSAWRMGALLLAVLYAQLILGAVVRHTGEAFTWHLAGALAVSFLAGRLAFETLTSLSRFETLSFPAYALVVLILAQWGLGLAAFLTRFYARASFESWIAAMPTLHVACGALILTVTAVWTQRAYQNR